MKSVENSTHSQKKNLTVFHIEDIAIMYAYDKLYQYCSCDFHEPPHFQKAKHKLH